MYVTKPQKYLIIWNTSIRPLGPEGNIANLKKVEKYLPVGRALYPRRTEIFIRHEMLASQLDLLAHHDQQKGSNLFYRNEK